MIYKEITERQVFAIHSLFTFLRRAKIIDAQALIGSSTEPYSRTHTFEVTDMHFHNRNFKSSTDILSDEIAKILGR